MKEPKATLKIFSTGSITVTGNNLERERQRGREVEKQEENFKQGFYNHFTAPCVSSIAAAIEHIYPLVYEFKKERTKEDELDLELKRQKKNGMMMMRKRKRLESYEEEEYGGNGGEYVETQDYSEEDSDWIIDEALSP